MIEETLCELIINEYYDKVYNFCFANLNRNKQAAEDCTQETFLTFFSKRNKLEFTENIHRWLYKTAKKVIKAYMRKNKKIFINSSKFVLITCIYFSNISFLHYY